MVIQYSSICDIGLKAKENQDRVLCLSDDHGGLFVVADGMGGLADGSFASQTIVEELTSWWHHYSEETCPIDEEKNGTESLKEAIGRANEKILTGTPEGKRCGSTVVALLLEGNRYSVIYCGDSRCYRAERRMFTTEAACLTKDDIWENNETNIRGLTTEMIRNHRNRGKLVRAVGTGTAFSCSVLQGTMGKKTAFLLCSDGLHKRVSDADVEKALKQTLTGSIGLMKESCESLKKKVYARGASDNISIILVCPDNLK